jgi:hypothetical protein
MRADWLIMLAAACIALAGLSALSIAAHIFWKFMR